MQKGSRDSMAYAVRCVAVEAKAVAHLTDTSKMYLFNLEGALKPFVFQAREPLTRGMKGLEDL